MKKQRDEVTLNDLANIFLPKLWFIVLVSIVFAGAFGGYSMIFKPDTYTSTAKYMIGKVPYSNSTSETVGLNASEVEAMQTMIENSMQIINATDFSEDVLEKILEHDIDNSLIKDDLNREYQSLKVELESKIKSVENAIKGETNADKLKDLNDKLDNYNIALDVLHETYPDLISALDRPLITEEQINAINSIQKENISVGMIKGAMSVSLTGTNTTCYNFTVTTSNPDLSLAIATAAGEILSERLIDTGYAIKVDCIQVPRRANTEDSKHVLRNSVIGLVAGALISMLFVFVISKLDVIVRSKEKLEATFDIPVIGMIPSFEEDN